MDTNANRAANGSNEIRGTLLRLSGRRSVAIYLRNGAVSVADFRDGGGRILSLAEWHSVHARRLAHALRRDEVEIVSPIPAEFVIRIELLHRRLAETPAHSLKQALGALPTEMREMFSRLARLLPDPVAAGGRMIRTEAFRID